MLCHFSALANIRELGCHSETTDLADLDAAPDRTLPARPRPVTLAGDAASSFHDAALDRAGPELSNG